MSNPNTPAFVPKIRPKQESIENKAARYQAAKQAMADLGIQVKHFRLKRLSPVGVEVSETGGITVAFSKNSTSYVEISTAICSQNDNYDRKAGTVLAVEQFVNERRIRVPAFRLPADEAVDLLFDNYTTFE